jgi:hypothetical protein
MSYDLDVKLEYTSASPETVIINIQFITYVNLFYIPQARNWREEGGQRAG